MRSNGRRIFRYLLLVVRLNSGERFERSGKIESSPRTFYERNSARKTMSAA